jgi:hypothetical protein
MTVEEQVEAYIAAQPEPKRNEMRELHRRILQASPDCRLWFLDGRNEDGKIVANPNIGYGHQIMHYAGGRTREFYRIGLSANTTGLSLYLMGIADKAWLARTFGERLGKASITGYCIKFRRLGELDMAVLDEVIRTGIGSGRAEPGRPGPDTTGTESSAPLS